MQNNVRRLTLRLPDELHSYLKKRAEKKHRSLTAELVDTIRELKDQEMQKAA